MAFDITSAVELETMPSFDLSSAKPIDDNVDFTEVKELGYLASIKESFIRGERSLGLDEMGYEALVGTKDYARDIKPQEDAFQKEVQSVKLTSDTWYYDLSNSLASMMPAMGKGLATGAATGAVVGGGATLVGTPALGVAGFAAGTTVGSFGFWYKQGAGQLFRELSKEGVDDSIAKPTAHLAGALYGGIEFAQVTKLFPAGAEAIKSAVKTSVMNTVKNMALKHGADWAVNVGQEGVQTAILEASKEAAKSITGKQEGALFDTVNNVMLKSWESVKESALPMLFLIGPKASIDTAKAVTMAKESVSTEAANRQAVEQAVSEIKPTTAVTTVAVTEVTKDISKSLSSLGIQENNIQALIDGSKSIEQVVDEQLGIYVNPKTDGVDSQQLTIEPQEDGSRVAKIDNDIVPYFKSGKNVGIMSHEEAIDLARKQAKEQISSILSPADTTEKIRGLSKTTESVAIEEGLTKDFGDLPTYKQRGIAEIKATRAAEIISKDHELAEKIATRQAPEINDVRAEEMYSALRTYGRMKGDSELLRRLATSESAAEPTTEMGQRIAALRVNDETDPIQAQTTVVRERVQKFEKKNGKGSLKKQVAKEKKQVTEFVNKELESMDWDEFVNSLEC